MAVEFGSAEAQALRVKDKMLPKAAAEYTQYTKAASFAKKKSE